MLNRYGDAAAMHESESEIVERQRLGLPVTELTHDRERGTMLLGCLFVLAFTSKLRAELIESKRLTLPVDCDWFPPKGLRGTRSQRADHRGESGREVPQSLPKPELAEPRLKVLGSPLDRTEGRLQPPSHRIAAQEPRRSDQGAPEEGQAEGNQQDGYEPKSGQHSGQQEPHAGEHENATAQLR